MLYITTRDNRDAFTAYRTLSESRGPDGGLYLPMRMPDFRGLLEKLPGQSFGQNVADVLNVLFKCRLTGWDVEFSVGRSPVRFHRISRRILAAEAWHNPEGELTHVVFCLVNKLRAAGDTRLPVGNWAHIAVKAAVLFGAFGEIMKEGSFGNDFLMDISVASGDFSTTMAAWYGRSWGLPIGNIICCCNENDAIWDLIHHGQMRTDAVAIETMTPECDFVVPPNLEYLIWSTLGMAEVERFVACCHSGSTYTLQGQSLEKLREGLYVRVISQRRAASVIPNVYKTTGYAMDLYTALSYGGLLDYWAQTGESRDSLILAEKCPHGSTPTRAENP